MNMHGDMSECVLRTKPEAVTAAAAAAHSYFATQMDKQGNKSSAGHLHSIPPLHTGNLPIPAPPFQSVACAADWLLIRADSSTT